MVSDGDPEQVTASVSVLLLLVVVEIFSFVLLFCSYF
jgi:hypothetical protein